MSPDKLKELILDTVNDLVSDFLYYDRKSDDELFIGDIEKAITDDIISISEIVDRFRSKLHEGLAE